MKEKAGLERFPCPENSDELSVETKKAVIDVLVQPVNAHSEREQTCCPGEGHNCGINTSEFRVLTKKRPGAQSSYALKRINPGKTRINPGKTQVIPGKTTQRKVKERKVKYSKGK